MTMECFFCTVWLKYLSEDNSYRVKLNKGHTKVRIYHRSFQSIYLEACSIVCSRYLRNLSQLKYQPSNVHLKYLGILKPIGFSNRKHTYPNLTPAFRFISCMAPVLWCIDLSNIDTVTLRKRKVCVCVWLGEGSNINIHMYMTTYTYMYILCYCTYCISKAICS